MSRNRRCRRQSEEIRSYFWSIEIAFGSELLSDAQIECFRWVNTIWMHIVYDLMNHAHPDCARRVILRFFGRMPRVWDMWEILSTLDHLDQALLDPTKPDLIPVFVSTGALLPLNDVLREVIAGESAAMMCQRLHQIFSFPLRVNVEGLESIASNTEEKYFANLERVAGQRVSDELTSEVLRGLVKGWKVRFAETDCRHGSGRVSTSTRKDAVAKFAQCPTNPRVNLFYHRFIDDSTDPVFSINGCRDKTVSKLTFVPKSYKTHRSIAWEDGATAFYQQGLYRTILPWMLRDRRTPIDDCTQHWWLANLGSRTREYATIDLSSASDSISNQWLRDTLCGTEFGFALQTLRSSHAEYKGGLVNLPMYASMGSALCFPTMCNVLRSVCEATIIDSGDKPRDSSFSVYGDDIIIEQKYVDNLLERLTRLGFIPNTDKSFFTSFPFRESCGSEWYNGVDVRPVRIPRRFSGIDRTVNCYTHMAYLANECYKRSYTATRLFLIDTIRTVFRNDEISFSDSLALLESDEWTGGSSRADGFYSPFPTDGRYVDEWQRNVVPQVYAVAVPRERYPEASSEARLAASLHALEIAHDGERRIAVGPSNSVGRIGLR